MLRQLSGHRSGDRAEEGGEAELTDGGAAQGRRAVDGREEDVADVGPFEREGPAPASGPQAHRDRDGGDAAEPARAVVSDVAQARSSDRRVTDGVGRHDQPDESDDRREVGAVEHVHPVDVDEVLGPSVLPPLPERALEVSIGKGVEHGGSR